MLLSLSRKFCPVLEDQKHLEYLPKVMSKKIPGSLRGEVYLDQGLFSIL